jgi:uncharacterized protein
VGESADRLADFCARVLKVPPTAIQNFRILRKSLDIRNKGRLEHVYTAAVDVPDEPRALQKAAGRAIPYQPALFEPPNPGPELLEHPPIIVGAGPAGLLAAHQLAQMGYCPIVIERGRSVRERSRDVRIFDRGGSFDEKSNYLFGEGGAGTFSDGKLTCRNTGPDTDRVLEILADAKGKPSILYEAKPHLGSNRLPAVVKALRQQIIEMGGTIHFDCRLEKLLVESGQVVGLETSTGYFPTRVVVLGIGHSARDTIAMLNEIGVPIEFKPFQMGVRIEQAQQRVTQVQYGKSWQAQLLGPADYTMNVKAGTQEVFSFCMCAGGYVMPSVSQEGYFCTNGMSRSFHESPFANSGIVVTVDAASVADSGFGHDPLAGIRYQAAIEKKAFELAGGDYHSPIQWARDFIDAKPTRDQPPSSYPRGTKPMNLADFLPGPIAKLLADGLLLMDRQWSGAFLEGATLVGPEARGSCPVRFPRDPVRRESIGIGGLYPIGEGAGYAGGIVSAAVDGLRSAKAVIARYKPFHR